MPKATAADILENKTAYVDNKKLTGTIPKQSGGIFVATKEKQIICPSKHYISGNITVKGDVNLKPKNIKSDVTIFGTTGTMIGNQAPTGRLPEDAKTVSIELSSSDGCNIYGGGVVSQGTTITVMAEEQKNYRITSFSWIDDAGNTVSTNRQYTFTVENHTRLIANFTAVKAYTIVTNLNLDDSGILTGNGKYDEGTNVTVNARANTGFRFVAWKERGTVVSESPSYTFVVDKSRNLTAEFEIIPQYTITASVIPDETWVSSISGTGTYYEGNTARLSASLKDYVKFVRWIENNETVSTSNNYSFVVERNRDLIAEVKKSRLPNGYTELEYIQIGPDLTIKFQYLAGSVNKNSTLYIDFEAIKFPSTTSQYANLLYASTTENSTIKERFKLCLSYTTSTTATQIQRYNGIRLGSLSSGNISSSNWFTITSNVTIPQRCKLLIDYPNLVVKSNDVVKGNLDSTYNLYNGYIYIGDNSFYNNGWGAKGATARIYELEFVNTVNTSSSYNRHWIPAKADDSGKIGLYDIVNNKWLYISIATAGPEV